MKNNFELEVKKVLKNAEKEMLDLNHPYVGSEHMLLAILKIDLPVTKILNKNKLYYKPFRDNLIRVVGMAHKKSEIALYTPLLKRIIASSLEDAEENNNGVVKCEHLVLALLEEGEGIAVRILLNMNIDLEKIYSEISKSFSVKKETSKSLLSDIGKNLTETVANEKIFKRDKEIENIIEILLRKNKNNPLLIGEAGVGKTAIVEELARLIKAGDVPYPLLKFKLIELDTGSLISGTRYRGDFEERLNKIIEEITAEKNIILFIDEVHTLVNCGGAEGAIDAANILKPYLARGDIKVIGATTNKEYHNTIYKDKALDRRFQIVNIEEPNIKDTEYILKNIKANYETHHNVLISDENIKDIIKYTEKYIYNKYNPDKCIDVLDSVCAHVQMKRPNKKNILTELYSKKEKLLKQKKYTDVLETELKIKSLEENTEKIQITKEDILNVIEYKANMPVLDNFNKKLCNLSKTLKQKILGQDEAIDEICTEIKNKYLLDNSMPLSLLLIGTNGVGKSYTAKEIANSLFGNNHFLKLEMSEFNSEMSISKLLGTSQGYVGYDDECLFNKIKDYPYSIILLDDIEKACYKVKNIFTQILENGYITNGKGETINFNNSTFIITSNNLNSEKIGFNKSIKTIQSEDNVLEKLCKKVSFNKIDIVTAKKYIKREKGNLDITSKEIDNIIKTSYIEKDGLRGVQKNLNKYKIGKLITKVEV